MVSQKCASKYNLCVQNIAHVLKNTAYVLKNTTYVGPARQPAQAFDSEKLGLTFSGLTKVLDYGMV